MVDLRYLVEVDGNGNALKHLPGLFLGPDYTITTDPDGRVFLSGASFETCASVNEVVETASRVDVRSVPFSRSMRVQLTILLSSMYSDRRPWSHNAKVRTVGYDPVSWRR